MRKPSWRRPNDPPPCRFAPTTHPAKGIFSRRARSSETFFGETFPAGTRRSAGPDPIPRYQPTQKEHASVRAFLTGREPARRAKPEGEGEGRPEPIRRRSPRRNDRSARHNGAASSAAGPAWYAECKTEAVGRSDDDWDRDADRVFQTISRKTEATDGRSRIGAADRIGT